ncbi:hypothetical protein MLA66_004782 [Salmonella enterica]|nr:type II toxin-antitoxin system VapC family toxin [Salmonella enterica]EEM7113296.1 hypothetical protein [Salmonella enterica subsp. enterica serovar Poona]HBI5523702.1 hypothetical protein [Salmonella enterica subsp. enterica serovar Welikade]EEH1295004.1 type II toxin-antitoxin system VapC family toxin [Salmonella enterica]EEO3567274.1 hypothetical protein [Salmonella enterica subsp. enterica serovar Poona]
MMDATTEIKGELTATEMPIGQNDTAITEHAIAAGVVIVTNNTQKFERVPRLALVEKWTGKE